MCRFPRRAGSCRAGTVTVAANRRGSGSGEGLSDTRPDTREPLPLLHQGEATDRKAGLLAWKTEGREVSLTTAGGPSQARSLAFTAEPGSSPASQTFISGSRERLDKEKQLEVGRGRELFLCLAPAPRGCQKAVLSELRTQGQGPSPGPRRSHSAQAKVQGQLPGTLPSHTLLITHRKRKTGQGQSWDPPLEAGSGGCWQLPKLQGPFSKVLLGGRWGGGKRSPQVCVSRMRSDTWWRLLVLPSFAREGGAHGSQAEPGGAGGVVGGRTRGEVVCCLPLEALAVGS